MGRPALRAPGELEPARWAALRRYETGAGEDAWTPPAHPLLAVTLPYDVAEITRLAPTCYPDTYLVWLTPGVAGRYRVGTARTCDLAAWLWPEESGASTAAGTGRSRRRGGRLSLTRWARRLRIIRE